MLKEGDTGELLEVIIELFLSVQDTGDPNILATPEADGKKMTNNQPTRRR